MISAWWLLPALLVGGICGFALYDFWGIGLLDRWVAQDVQRKAERDKEYRLSQVPAKLKRVWPDLTDDEAAGLERLNQLSGSDFESVVGQLFERMGYAVKLVGGSGDHGIDLIAENGHERIAIQCKRYGIHTPIPNGALRDFLGAIQPYQPCRAVFVTTSYLTRKAEEFQGIAHMEIYSGRDIVRLLNDHGVQPQLSANDAAVEGQ